MVIPMVLMLVNGDIPYQYKREGFLNAAAAAAAAVADNEGLLPLPCLRCFRRTYMRPKEETLVCDGPGEDPCAQCQKTKKTLSGCLPVGSPFSNTCSMLIHCA